jgi:hypothetical protein
MFTIPMLSLVSSVNQRLPSGPVVMSIGLAPDGGAAYSVTTPAVVILPM